MISFLSRFKSAASKFFNTTLVGLSQLWRKATGDARKSQGDTRIYHPLDQKPGSPLDLRDGRHDGLVDAFSSQPLEVRQTLSQLSGLFRQAFLPDVEQERLLTCVAWGNQAGAEHSLQIAIAHDKAAVERAKAEGKTAENENARLIALLCGKATNPVRDPSDKPIQGLTAFQAALCAGDVAIHPGEVNMCEMFKRYFKRLPNGLELMQQQVKEIFPGGFPEDKKVHAPHILAQGEKAKKFKEQVLTPLFEAIRAAPHEQLEDMEQNKSSDSTLGQVFETFRQAVKQYHAEDQIFNPYYLLEALNLYKDRLSDFSHANQHSLFCDQCIMFIQGYQSACNLQAWARLEDIAQGEVKLSRFVEFHPKRNGGVNCRSARRLLHWELPQRLTMLASVAARLLILNEVILDYSKFLWLKKTSLEVVCRGPHVCREEHHITPGR